MWKKLYTIGKNSLIVLGSILLAIITVLTYRRISDSDNGGVQPDNGADTAIRDGFAEGKDAINGSIGNVESSIGYTDAAVGKLQRARQILEEARRRTAENNKKAGLGN